MASLLMGVSDSTADVFFGRNGAFQLNISTKKHITQNKNVNISSLKQDFKNLRQFLSSYKQKYNAAKKYFFFFYHKKLEFLEITQKRNCKNHVQKIYIKYLQKILLCPQSNGRGSFSQTCINFIERLKLSNFEGYIIP